MEDSPRSSWLPYLFSLSTRRSGGRRPGTLSRFDWNRQGDGLFAQVSLFNDLNYKILLCPRYSGLLQDIRTGHHFDLQSRTISALGAATLAG